MPGRSARSLTFALLAIASSAGWAALVVPSARADSAVSSSAPALSVAPAEHELDCTLTFGYWRNHPESWTRVASLALGTVTYDRAQLLAILNAPVAGNGLVLLAHQLVAAKLDLLLGAEPPPDVAAAIDAADAMIGSLMVPPVGSGTLRTAQVGDLAALLTRFNEGQVGPGHCPEDTVITPVRTPTWGAIKTIYR